MHWKLLNPLDIQKSYDFRDIATSSKLAQAWDQAIEQYWKQDLCDLKNGLYAQHDVVTPSQTLRDKLPEKRKRKSTPNLKYPPGYGREELDDDESHLFACTSENATSSIKKEFVDSTSMTEDGGLYEDSESPVHSRTTQPSKRHRLNATSLFSTSLAAPIENHNQSELSNQMRSSIYQTSAKVIQKNLVDR